MNYNFYTWLGIVAKNSALWLIAALGIVSAIVTVSLTGRNISVPFWIFPMILLIGFIVSSYRVHKNTLRSFPKKLIEIAPEYDVFLAVPMAAFETDKEYEESRDDILEIMSSIRQFCGLQRIFYAGEDIKTKKEFDPEDMAYLGNFEKLYKSRFFVMMFPKKIVSSVLIEVGYALAIDLPILILIKNQNDLPYILKRLPQASGKIKIYEYKDRDDIKNIFSKHGKNIFLLLEKRKTLSLFSEFIEQK